jgi:hypothetical protein
LNRRSPLPYQPHGGEGGPLRRCLRQLLRVYEGIVEINLLLFPSFPRKRESRDFNRTPLGSRFRGGDKLAGRWHLFARSQDRAPVSNYEVVLAGFEARR